MAYVETRGKRHRGCYRDASGKLRSAGWFDGKRKALNAAQREEMKIADGVWVDPDAGKITLDVYFWDHWLPHRTMEERTKETYEGHYRVSMAGPLGGMPLGKITSSKVQRWVVDMEKQGVKPGTVVAKFKALQTILAAQRGVSAVRDGLISKNPCAGVTLPVVDDREVSVYGVKDTETLLAAMDAWWRPIAMLASESGMRWGELMGLRICDFTDDFSTVTAHQTIIELKIERSSTGTRFDWKPRPKSRKPRTIALSADCAAAMRKLVKARRLFGNDRLFSMPGKKGLPLRTDEWPEGLPISRSFFRAQVWTKAHEATGVQQRRFHDLRGSHISWLLAGGADLTAVMHRVGHTQMSTTQVYVHALADADKRALDALAITRARAQ